MITFPQEPMFENMLEKETVYSGIKGFFKVCDIAGAIRVLRIPEWVALLSINIP